MIIKPFVQLRIILGLLILLSCSSGYLFCQTPVKQGNPVPVNYCIGEREMTLYRMINVYRHTNKLPPIQLSKSLSYVASLHAKDLFLHHPDQGSCNFHSWSNKGFWVPFCYPRDENKKNSVWDKPRELTRYPSKGYEIVYWENNPLVTDTIMMVWTTEEYFNSFLLNTGKWQGKTWNAIGIAVYENYACAWFGDVNDPEGAAKVCGSVAPIEIKDTLKQVSKPVVKPVLKAKNTKTKKTGTNKADSLTIKPSDSLKPLAVVSPAIKHDTLAQKTDSTSITYYIIVNSILPKDKANNLVNTLNTKGYPDAKLLEKNGKLRVSIIESSDKAAIMVKLKEVKKSYKDAWLLRMTSDKGQVTRDK